MVIMAANEGIDLRTLTRSALPVLESAGLCSIVRRGSEIVTVSGLVLTYETLLEAVVDIYEESDPTDEDRGCRALLEAYTSIQTPEVEALQKASLLIGEEAENVPWSWLVY